MTTGHVTDHNTMRAAILSEATRFGTSVDIGGPFTIGDPAHINEHNRLVTALQHLAGIALVTVTLPDTAHLNDAGHISDHTAMQSALTTIQAAAAWNAATGGTSIDYTESGHTYRAHVFHTPGAATFTVTRAIPGRSFDILIVGGGGGGANGGDPGNGASGRGGNGEKWTTDLTAQAYSLTIGAGGTSGDVPQGGAGGATTGFGHTAGGGNAGGYGYTPTGGWNHSDTIDGTGSQYYGRDAAARAYQTMTKYGGGGGGGASSGQWGFGGDPGAVIVRYQIG